MHKGVLLLTKTSTKEEALDNVSNFMMEYQDSVYDWYSIGNRWHNILAPEDKLKQFKDWVKKEYKHAFTEFGSYSINALENDEERAIIQKKWEELGLKGKNIYYSAYGFNLNENEDNYNCVPLKDCLKVVKKWCNNLNKCAEEFWEKMIESKAEELNKQTGTLSAYYARRYAEAKYEDFCFNTNVFNVDTYEAEKIPEDIENYYVVVVDMHN